MQNVKHLAILTGLLLAAACAETPQDTSLTPKDKPGSNVPVVPVVTVEASIGADELGTLVGAGASISGSQYPYLHLESSGGYYYYLFAMAADAYYVGMRITGHPSASPKNYSLPDEPFLPTYHEAANGTSVDTLRFYRQFTNATDTSLVEHTSTGGFWGITEDGQPYLPDPFPKTGALLVSIAGDAKDATRAAVGIPQAFGHKWTTPVTLTYITNTDGVITSDTKTWDGTAVPEIPATQ